MPCECFHQLCENIKRNVGEREFCSEDYIKEHLKHGTSKEACMYQAHENTSGGWLCGEVRAALALRMLAEASHLDLAIIFNVAYGHCHSVFHDVIEHWFCKDWVYPYLLEKALDDPCEMYKLSTHFASKSRSGGIMAGNRSFRRMVGQDTMPKSETRQC